MKFYLPNASKEKNIIRKMPTLNLVLRNDQKGKDGKVHIYLMIGRRKLSVDRKIDVEYWNGVGPKWIKESHEFANDLNYYLEGVISKAKIIFQIAFSQNKFIYYHEFKKELFSIDDVEEAFKKDRIASMKWADYHKIFIERKKKLLGQPTINHYNTHFNKLNDFSKEVRLNGISVDFLNKYKAYLQYKLNNKTNTIGKNLGYIRQILIAAINDGLITEKNSPFMRGYKLKWSVPKPVFLNFEELVRLEDLYSYEILAQPHQNVLKYFLFSIYTGMDYGDVKNFKYKDIERFQGKYIINRSRNKGNANYIIYINSKAQKLIKNLQGMQRMSKKEKDSLVFRVINNTSTNQYLRIIMERAKIHKKITFHKARHTYATLSGAMGIPSELIQGGMGHSSSVVTEKYIHVVKSNFINEFKRWDEI